MKSVWKNERTEEWTHSATKMPGPNDEAGWKKNPRHHLAYRRSLCSSHDQKWDDEVKPFRFSQSINPQINIGNLYEKGSIPVLTSNAKKGSRFSSLSKTWFSYQCISVEGDKVALLKWNHFYFTWRAAEGLLETAYMLSRQCGLKERFPIHWY